MEEFCLAPMGSRDVSTAGQYSWRERNTKQTNQRLGKELANEEAENKISSSSANDQEGSENETQPDQRATSYPSRPTRCSICRRTTERGARERPNGHERIALSDELSQEKEKETPNVHEENGRDDDLSAEREIETAEREGIKIDEAPETEIVEEKTTEHDHDEEEDKGHEHDEKVAKEYDNG